MKKTILMSAAIVAGVAGSASASCAPKVTLGGSLDTQVGFRKQENAFEYEKPNNILAASGAHLSNKLNDFAIVNDTKVMIGVDGKTEMFAYGAKVTLFSDTSKAKEEFGDSDSRNAKETMAFFEGNFGRFEVGSTEGATKKMQVGAQTLARATGGVDGDARYWWNPRTFRTDVSADSTTFAAPATRLVFLETPNLPTNEIGKHGVRGKNAAKISYYTPNFSGFMIGASYIPDLQAHGSIAQSGSTTKTISAVETTELNWNARPYRSIFEGGVHYEGMFDQISVKAAVLAQTGSAKKELDTGTGITSKTHKSLRAYEAGMNASYMGFSLGGSYGYWGQSGTRSTPTDGSAHKTRYYTLGAAYEYGPYGISLTYMNSENGYDVGATAVRKANKLDVISLGMDYKVAPGLMPYLEVTTFDMKDKKVDGAVGYGDGPTSTGLATKSNDGYVVMLGTKLVF